MVEDSKDAERERQEKEEEGEEEEEDRYTRKGSDFSRTIAKIAVSQICENEGFHGLQHSALEALSDVASRYLKEIGKASNLYCNLGGRSECNVFDLIQGLEDLGLVQGFPGASDVHRSLSNSGVVKEIQQYVNFVENVPFIFHIPSFQVSKQSSHLPCSFLKPPAEHIPPWLPSFPVPENTVVVDASSKVVVEESVEGVELVKDVQLDVRNDNDRILAKVNPFLAPPLHYGDKDVSFVQPPSIFLMSTYGIGMTENEGLSTELCEIQEAKNTLRSNDRPPVRFHFSNAINSRSISKKKQKLSSFFCIEEGIDEHV